jgi:dipeptidyl aminopeptidase/acylaminoacyl peptidase
MVSTAPYGSWRSPVTPELLVENALGLGSTGLIDGRPAWVESRASEGGRQVLVVLGSDGEPHDQIPEGFSVRSSLHEYGGRCWAPCGAGAIFANWSDQRLYRVTPGADGEPGVPEPLTPEPPSPRSVRYADLEVSPDGTWMVAARERHAGTVENDLVAVSLTGSAPTDTVALAGGHDFVAAGRISPDGRRLAWLTWDHPDMPWDHTELWVAVLAVRPAGGVSLSDALRMAGADGESVSQPRWSPDGELHYISDRTGWWNLYDEKGRALAPLDAEFAEPDWVVGQSSYTFLADGRLVATCSAAGGQRLGVVAGGALRAVALPDASYNSVVGAGDSVVAVAGSATTGPAVVRIDIDEATVAVVRRSRPTTLDPAYVSAAQAIEFPSADGRRAHAYWYPPTNPDYIPPPGERPPLVVMSHGGPTSAASATLSYPVQFWTTRGFGVVDVDYGGSSGYGREYRRLLRDRWGIVDVDDCVAAAQWLAEAGWVDPARMVIRGGSAGGYTTLAALAFRDVFAAGASHFGVADLELLARDTHKFESRYLDGLVGPYPEAIDIYRARSPIHHLEGLTRPIILFQGLEDAVVPPAQAELMAVALAERGVPVAHLTFEGEQHGFRQAATITRVIRAELAFYGRVLGFRPADDTEPFAIVNESALPVW